MDVTVASPGKPASNPPSTATNKATRRLQNRCAAHARENDPRNQSTGNGYDRWSLRTSTPSHERRDEGSLITSTNEGSLIPSPYLRGGHGSPVVSLNPRRELDVTSPSKVAGHGTSGDTAPCKATPVPGDTTRVEVMRRVLDNLAGCGAGLTPGRGGRGL